MRMRLAFMFFLTFIRLAAVAQQRPETVEYVSERPMQIVEARITDKSTGKPAAGKRAYLSVPARNFELRTAVSDSSGKLKFFLQAVYPSKPMIFLTDARRDSNYAFVVEDPFLGKKYSREKESDSLAFFGEPDRRYLLDNYTRFPTLEEVLIEYVPEVKIRKSRGHFEMQVLNTPVKSFFEDEPLVLLDGLPVFDIDALMAIDPLKIKKLEVMARRYYYGTITWSGIVSFSTYEGDLGGYVLPPNALVKEFHR